MEFISFFCDGARTGDDGKLDVSGIYNELYARAFPARQDEICLVFLLQWGNGDEGRKPFSVDLNDPTGASVFTVDGYTDITARSDERPPPRTHLVLPLTRVVFPAAGTYRTEFTIDDRVAPGAALYLTQVDE